MKLNEKYSMIDVVFSLYTLFLYKSYIYLYGMIGINIILSIEIFHNFFPILFYSISNIIIFLYVKKDIKFLLFVYQIYYLIFILVIKLNIAHLVGYSDQFDYINVSNYYFNSNYNIFDILFNKIDFQFFQMEILWTKIFYILRYISIGNNNVALVFNFSLYFFAVLFIYKTFATKRKMILYKIKSLFVFLLFIPPVFFINSLYLKESFILSSMIFFMINLYKKQYIFSLFWFIIFFKLRSSYAVLFLMIYFFVKTFYIQNKIYKKFLFLIYSITLVFIFSLAINLHINNKLFNYFQAIQNSTQLKNNTATVTKFINHKDLLSVKNIFIISTAGILSPSPTRFIKSKSIVSFLESILVSVFWWILFPYFIIFFLEEKEERFKIILTSMFFTILLASSLSILTPAPEPFRYRLVIYSVLLLGSFFGMYYYKYLYYYKYRIYIKYWFIITSIIYILYIFV